MEHRRPPAPPRADALDEVVEPAASGPDAELPIGVEPWRGEEMPTGTASSHGLHGGSRELPAEPVDPGDDGAGAGADDGADEPLAASLPPEPDPVAISADDELNYRRLYEDRFRQLDTALREQAAHHATGSILFALCLDPAAQVVAALLDNPRFGLEHARSVAQHHPNARGLEILARRAQLLRDSHVQRRLLQNVQAPDVVLDRVLRFKRLIDVYRLSVDRDLPERNRVRVRSRLRPLFTRAEPEDRAALLIKTEGRCLASLAGCTFDARLTQLLCSQTIVSTLFIQNLARFGATPPALIAKLLRSPTVQRQPALRALLSKHPNATGEAKRRG